MTFIVGDIWNLNRIIEYALNQEGTDILSFELYESLSVLHSFIVRLEHAERMMTEHGMRYRNISQKWDKESMEYQTRNADNRFNFFKFRVASLDRTESLKDIAKRSEYIVQLVNNELGPEMTRKAEIDMIYKYLEAGLEREFIVERFLQYLDTFSDEEQYELIDEYGTDN